MYCRENCSICLLGLPFSKNPEKKDMPTKIEGKGCLSNYKCEYHLTRKFHFWKIVLQVSLHANVGTHYSIICRSKTLGTIHMSIKRRRLNMNDSPSTQRVIPVIPQSQERMRKLSAMTCKDLRTVPLTGKCRESAERCAQDVTLWVKMLLVHRVLEGARRKEGRWWKAGGPGKTQQMGDENEKETFQGRTSRS